MSKLGDSDDLIAQRDAAWAAVKNLEGHLARSDRTVVTLRAELDEDKRRYKARIAYLEEENAKLLVVLEIARTYVDTTHAPLTPEDKAHFVALFKAVAALDDD